jgi:hypothetical protein
VGGDVDHGNTQLEISVPILSNSGRNRLTKTAAGQGQGCQMVSFQTKIPNLGKFWRALNGKMLIYLMAIWNILRTFGIFYDHVVRFLFIW